MPKETFLNLPQSKREMIMELAIEEFSTKPYSKASLSNIVARAGIAKGSMYQYFEDKKDLYSYLLDLAGQEKLNFVKGISFNPGTDDFFVVFEKMLLAGARFNLAHPRLGQLAASAMNPSGDQELQQIHYQLMKQSYDFLKELVQKAQKEKKIRQDLDLELAAALLQGTLSQGLTNYLLNKLDISLDQLLTDPQIVQSISEEELEQLVKQIVTFLKQGMKGEDEYA